MEDKTLSDPTTVTDIPELKTDFSFSQEDYRKYVYWTVIAVDDKGATSSSNTTSFRLIPNASNTPPQDFKLLSPSDTEGGISLTHTFKWEAAQDLDNDKIFYELYIKRTTENQYYKIASDIETNQYTAPYPLNFPSKTDVLIDHSQWYNWYVVARDSVLKNLPTQSEIFTFKSVPEGGSNIPPTKPSSLSPSTNSTNQKVSSIELSWQKSIDQENPPNALNYSVYLFPNQKLFSIPDGSTPKFKGLKSSSSENRMTKILTFQDLEFNTTYSWAVRVADEDGGVAISDVYNFTTYALNNFSLKVKNSEDNEVAIDAIDASDVFFSWDEIIHPEKDGTPENLFKYSCYVQEVNDKNELIGNATRVLTNQTDLKIEVSRNLSHNTKYKWWVIGQDLNRKTTYSDSMTIVTKKAITNRKPSPPILVSPENNAKEIKGSQLFEWQASTDADSDNIQYKLIIEHTNSLEEIFTDTLEVGTATSYQVNNLKTRIQI